MFLSYPISMKSLYPLLFGILFVFTSCESKEAEPEAVPEKLFIEFLVNGTERVSLSQEEDSTVQVAPSSRETSAIGSDISKLEYFSRITGNQSIITLQFSHTTDLEVRDSQGNVSERFFEYLRNTVMAKPVRFHPADDSEGFAFRFEYFDQKTQRWYYSVLHKWVNNIPVTFSGDQSNSSFVITHHQKYKTSDVNYKYFESEQIEGTFHMTLHSLTDSIIVTNGKFKTFLTID